jgi:adenosylhomocysteine nucleosidase
MKHTHRKIGIMGAVQEEVADVIALLSNPKETIIGKRKYISGEINHIPTVVVFSRWGKVAAATTVSALIHKFQITELIFTGVAGAISPDLNIGDIVLGKRLIQHDMDSRPMYKQFEIPLLNKIFFEADENHMKIAESAINNLLETNNFHSIFSSEILQEFNLTNPQLKIGDIASGDVFFSNTQQKETLYEQLPSVLCVEMEGAAVAQVCYEYEIPCTVIRTISDTADEKSHIDFSSFIRHISSIYSAQIIQNMYANL